MSVQTLGAAPAALTALVVALASLEVPGIVGTQQKLDCFRVALLVEKQRRGPVPPPVDDARSGSVTCTSGSTAPVTRALTSSRSCLMLRPDPVPLPASGGLGSPSSAKVGLGQASRKAVMAAARRSPVASPGLGCPARSVRNTRR